jgi:hypothetical protein
MDQDLKNAVLSKLNAEQSNTKSDSTDLFNELGQKLMANDIGSRLETAFNQVAQKSGVSDQTDFEQSQSLKNQVMSKSALTEAFGISIVPTISSLVGSFLPVGNLGALGGLQMGSALGGVIGGYALQKIGKSSTITAIGNGVIKGSIATFIGGFSNNIIGGFTSGIGVGGSGSGIPEGVSV